MRVACCTDACCVLQDEVETALACTDVTQLDVSAITSVNDDPQQALRLRIRRQTKFLSECREMKASGTFHNNNIIIIQHLYSALKVL